MNYLQRIKSSLQSDRETLKRLSLKQKLQFCISYYKGAFFVFLICCLGLFYVGDAILQSQQELVLQGFFSNDDANLFPAKNLEAEYSKTLNLGWNQRISFDDSLYVDLNSSADYAASSQGKIVAYIAAKELDFLVTKEDLALFYIQGIPCYDLDQLLPEPLHQQLSSALYYSTDGTGAYKACAINLSTSRFFRDNPSYTGSDYYLLVPGNTSHQEAIADFIAYAFAP